ncbi:ATP-grasp domain-containing protein, partial [Vibrio parahaemolyticus]
RDIFPRLADRFPQKSLFDSLQLATAPWARLESPEQWPELFATLGDFLIVKRRTGGYDGRGQWRVRPGDETQLPAE